MSATTLKAYFSHNHITLFIAKLSRTTFLLFTSAPMHKLQCSLIVFMKQNLSIGSHSGIARASLPQFIPLSYNLTKRQEKYHPLQLPHQLLPPRNFNMILLPDPMFPYNLQEDFIEGTNTNRVELES